MRIGRDLKLSGVWAAFRFASCISRRIGSLSMITNSKNCGGSGHDLPRCLRIIVADKKAYHFVHKGLKMPKWVCNICGATYDNSTDAEICHAEVEEMWRCTCCGGIWNNKLDAASCCADITMLDDDKAREEE